jgi:hypothetical protein
MPRIGQFTARALHGIGIKYVISTATTVLPNTPTYLESTSLLYMRAITYGAGKFVAVGADGYVGSSAYYTTSVDGTSFSTPALMNGAAVPFSVYGLAYGNGVFAAIGLGSNNYSTSTNGTTWATPTLTTNDLGYIYGLAFGAGKFVAVGASGSAIASYSTSTNGTYWSTATTMPFGTGNGQMNAVTYTSSTWVAVGNTAGNSSGAFYSTSTNGTTWSAPAAFNGVTTDSGGALSVAGNNAGTVVAVGGIGAVAPGLGATNTWFSYSTNNGASWSTPTTFPGTSSTGAVVMTSIIYNPVKSQFYAVGATSTGTAVYATSTNGISWNGLYSIPGAVFGNPQAVAVNSTGTRQVMVGMDPNNNNYPTFIYN